MKTFDDQSLYPIYRGVFIREQPILNDALYDNESLIDQEHIQKLISEYMYEIYYNLRTLHIFRQANHDVLKKVEEVT